MFRYCLLLLLVGAALTPYPDASAFYAPRVPEGEPPLVRVRIERINKTIFQQFFDLPARILPEFSGTIAERYRLLGDRPDALLPHSLAITCQIEPAGLVRSSTCKADESGAPDAMLALRAAKLAGALRNFPRFRDLGIKEGARAPFFRFVRFELRTPQVPPATINFEQGPLVEMQQIPALILAWKSNHSIREYPVNALREGRGGKGLAECQVQHDLSIACRMLSFEPVENAALFTRELQKFFQETLADSKLANGGDARGARVQFRVNWSIPGGAP